MPDDSKHLKLHLHVACFYLFKILRMILDALSNAAELRSNNVMVQHSD